MSDLSLLEAQYDQLKRELQLWRDYNYASNQERQNLKARIARLREALEYYAKKYDYGTVAQQILADDQNEHIKNETKYPEVTIV